MSNLTAALTDLLMEASRAVLVKWELRDSDGPIPPDELTDLADDVTQAVLSALREDLEP